MTVDKTEFVEIFDEKTDPHGMPIYSGEIQNAYKSLTPGFYRAQLGVDDECVVNVGITQSIVAPYGEPGTPDVMDCVNAE